MGRDYQTRLRRFHEAKWDEELRNPNIVEIHPLQDPSTLQGLLEIYYKTEQFMKEISGLVSQPT